MEHLERAQDIAGHLGYVFKRDHLAFSLDRISASYQNFLRAMASKATALETAVGSLSEYSDNLNRFQEDLQKGAPVKMLLRRTPPFSSRQLETSDVDALEYAVAHYRETLEDAKATLYEMFLVSTISSFEAYVKDLVYDIYTNYPKTLRSSKTLTYQEALECLSIDELIAHLARKAASKSTEGTVEEYMQRLQQKFGVELSGIDFLIKNLERCVAIRNVVVHNNGIVDSHFLSRQPTEMLQEGDKIELTLSDIAGISEIVRLATNFVEIIFVHKFPEVAIVEWSEVIEGWSDSILAMEDFAASESANLTDTEETQSY